MGAPKLRSAVFLKNHGVRVSYAGTGIHRIRFEPPNGTLTVGEAALALKTYPVLMDRLLRLKRLKYRMKGCRRMIRVSECLRLKRLWRGKAPTTLVGE
jgi:hypothetical protein